MFLRPGRNRRGTVKAKISQNRKQLFTEFESFFERGNNLSKIKGILIESQKGRLKLLKPKIGENMKRKTEDETENETRSFYTPIKSVRITSSQNNDPNASRNMVTGDQNTVCIGQN